MTRIEDDDEIRSVARVRLIMIPILIAVAAMGVLDLIADSPDSWLSAHVVLELTLIATSLGGAAFLGLGWRRAAGELVVAQVALASREAEAAEWRQRAESALGSLATAIQDQLERWGLTPAEREVAVLLLQGHGHKQIAFATGRSERTVRQHAVAVYEKSGLHGRAELAAFFLGGLGQPASGSTPLGR